ncbi:MAG: IS3 family transposase [Candidatus Riflebacteria bacterium]|nr:IS3 family transposase [Candidatus Riflebacteria bacterium]
MNQEFDVSQPNDTWVTDITYIPTNAGWLYLAGVKDICTCEIVGYAMDRIMTTELVATAIKQAVKTKRPGRGLLHHSDRGSQYCAHSYRKLLVQLGMISSMSKKGDCYDNAPMESFWGTLKTELVHHRRYETRSIVMREITEFIEIFYNRPRRHSRLGNIAPATFARQFNQNGQEKAAE